MKKITIVAVGLLVVLGLEVIRTIWQQKRYEGLLPSCDDLPELTGEESEVQEALLQRQMVMGACHLRLARGRFPEAEWLASAIERVLQDQTEAAWWLRKGPSLVRDRRILARLAALGGVEDEHLYREDGSPISQQLGVLID